MAKNGKAKRWTEADVAGMVSKLYPSPAFAYLTSVRNGTGFARKRDRTIDGLAVSCYPSRGLYLAGIEVKVSRSDWRKELSDPDKAAEIQKYCRYWYVAAPAGIVSEGEVPETWGLIECQRSAKIVKTAPKTEEAPVDILLLCSILRRFGESVMVAYKVEALVKERCEKHRDAYREEINHELETLRRTIAEFEEASGVSLSRRWEAGHIGEAVKIIREHGVEQAVAAARRMRNEHANIVDRLDAVLSEIDPAIVG